jgi:hypothetical protein
MPDYDSSLFSPPAPFARVKLRNPETGATVDALAMLLDSGADVTMVPQRFVRQIGVAELNESYELMGFDGNTSRVAAVRLDLVFLRRAFKGRFLLTNQEWGLIGRDILNHVSILLDGPHLTWNEQL